MKIRELEVNQVVTITLVARSASSRKTKTGKPFLALELFDGTDIINGNYWDWGGVNIPSKNAVLCVQAQVSEWQSTKQLNIKSLSTATDVPLSDFMPKSNVDINSTYADAYALMLTVQDDFLRALTVGVLEALHTKWLEVPGAKGLHHAYVAGTLIHSYSVAQIALSIASKVPGADLSMCAAGGMLHDLGKLFSYDIDGVIIDMTDEGMLYNHLFIGAEFIGNYAEKVYDMDSEGAKEKLEMLRHILLAHHGKLEYGAVVPPLSMEAHIVYHADAIDAAAEQIRDSSKLEEAKWTDRIWALGNRPHLTTQYVSKIMTPYLSD